MNTQVTHGMQLPQPPSDGVTAMHFAANSELLLVSSWDGVRFSALWLRDVLAHLPVVTCMCGADSCWDAARCQSKSCVFKMSPNSRDLEGVVRVHACRLRS